MEVFSNNYVLHDYNFASRKDVNRRIKLLQLYYIYGNKYDLAHTVSFRDISNELASLRVYKNTYFPKKSLLRRLYNYIAF